MDKAKQTNKERLREITESIEQGVKDVFNSDKYADYLQTLGHFHNYSINNIILIHKQKPQATFVAGYKKWMNSFARHVKEGERGITIIAPTPYKKKIEEKKLDPNTQKPMLDRQGKEITEVIEIEIPMFKPVKVFDVSQTDGKPLPQLAEDLRGNVKHYAIFMEALRRSSSVPITFEQLNDADGYFNIKKQKIVIREGMSEVQTICAVIHEITHATLHNYERMRQESLIDNVIETPFKSEATEEIEAESVSYVVCKYYNIETKTNSFGYIATWSKDKELSELHDSLETIRKTASKLITDIDKHFQEISKEQGIDLSNVYDSAFAESNTVEEVEQSEITSKQSEIQLSVKAFNKYPLPDQTKKLSDLRDAGYQENDMLPISQDRAMKLFEQDITIYAISDFGEASMIFDQEDIITHNGLFAILKSEWEETKQFADSIKERINCEPVVTDNRVNKKVKDFEEQVKSGKPISLLELAKAMHQEKKQDVSKSTKKQSRMIERGI